MKYPKPNMVYMKVTQDKYQLPLVVAESEKELCELLGLKIGAVRQYIKYSTEHNLQYPRYIAVDLTEENMNKDNFREWNKCDDIEARTTYKEIKILGIRLIYRDGEYVGWYHPNLRRVLKK